ncbi:hypothetical protein AB0M47_20870 [Hamadaea sp. NPDC051192]|uniref:hypothetical protein n=1 Tax=Hamadaea sp. NPDC051192 TaxID=3154940 RepID=UPI00343BF560
MTSENVPTPAELRALAARVDELAAAIADVEKRLGAAADDPTRSARFRLDDAAGYARMAGEALNKTASDLVRVRARSNCPVDWGVCPEHGNTLTDGGGKSWCREPGCGRTWNYARGALPCTEPAVFFVSDAHGDGSPMCTGHTLDARQRLDGAIIRTLTSDDK